MEKNGEKSKEPDDSAKGMAAAIPAPAAGKTGALAQAAPTHSARTPRDLTPQETAMLDHDLDFNALIFMAEQSFGTPLNATDIARLRYWYVNFDRTSEIIEALLEYCTEQCHPGRPNTRYLDTVAAGWFSEGIVTADQAREYSQTRTTLVYGVMKAFGIKNKRDPNQTEQDLIRKWSKEYGFSNEMIFLACTRTAAKTSQDQFSYADRILSAWHREQIKTPADVEKADLEHRKRTAAAKRPVEISKSARQFHNFEERNTDYEELILNQYRAQNNDPS
jgi:DnaD/phage-associated family protein